MKFSQSSFSKNIQSAIAGKGLSIPKFADMLGVSKTTVYNWIHGRNRIQPRRVEEVAALLNVSPGWLMGYEEEKSEAASLGAPAEGAPTSVPYTVHRSPASDSPPVSKPSDRAFSYDVGESVEPSVAVAETPAALPRQTQEMPGTDQCRQAQDMIRHIVTELMELQMLFTGSSN